MTGSRKLIQLIGNGIFMLLIFLFVADPTNTIFGLKNVVFALLFLYSFVFFKADYSKILYFLIPVLAVTLSWVFAIMQGNHVNMEELKGVYTAFMPLLLLMWVGHYDVLRLSVFPLAITAVIVLALFWTIFFVPIVEAPIYEFMGSHNGTIMMSNRVFLGVKIFCMYPKSTAAFMPVFGFMAYRMVTKENRTFVSVLVTFLLLHMFLISGTRSSVLLPIFLFALIVFIYCRNGRYMKYLIYPLAIIFVIAFFFLLFMLLTEDDEPSNVVKYAHLASYKELFLSNPEYLIFGQGPGTSFYTEGFRKMTFKSEWTYLELLRNYGLMCLPILYVILRPLFSLFKLAKEHDSALAIAFSYIIYLIIAGTNPLLLSSTGMLVLLTVYSYSYKLKR